MSTIAHINVSMEAFVGLLSLILILCLCVAQTKKGLMERPYIRILICNYVFLFCDFTRDPASFLEEKAVPCVRINVGIMYGVIALAIVLVVLSQFNYMCAQAAKTNDNGALPPKILALNLLDRAYKIIYH